MGKLTYRTIKKMHTHSPSDPAVPLLRTYPEDTGPAAWEDIRVITALL